MSTTEPSPSPSASTSSLADQSSATSADLPPSPTQKEIDLPEEVKREKALTLKDEGNKLFVAGEYDRAKIRYGEGIAFDPTVVVLWSNRAACELKLEQHGLAIEDASAYRWPWPAKRAWRMIDYMLTLSQHSTSNQTRCNLC